MTEAEIQSYYDELTAMNVAITHDDVTPGHLRDRILTTRQFQDRITNLQILTNQEYAVVRSSVRAQKALTKLDATQANHDLLGVLEDTNDALRYLMESLKIRSTHLRQVGADLRLLVEIVDQQIRLGEVEPPAELPSDATDHQVAAFLASPTEDEDEDDDVTALARAFG